MSDTTDRAPCGAQIDGTDAKCGRLPMHKGNHRPYLTRRATRSAARTAAKVAPGKPVARKPAARKQTAKVAA